MAPYPGFAPPCLEAWSALIYFGSPPWTRYIAEATRNVSCLLPRLSLEYASWCQTPS